MCTQGRPVAARAGRPPRACPASLLHYPTRAWPASRVRLLHRPSPAAPRSAPPISGPSARQLLRVRLRPSPAAPRPAPASRPRRLLSVAPRRARQPRPAPALPAAGSGTSPGRLRLAICVARPPVTCASGLRLARKPAPTPSPSPPCSVQRIFAGSNRVPPARLLPAAHPRVRVRPAPAHLRQPAASPHSSASGCLAPGPAPLRLHVVPARAAAAASRRAGSARFGRQLASRRRWPAPARRPPAGARDPASAASAPAHATPHPPRAVSPPLAASPSRLRGAGSARIRRLPLRSRHSAR